MRRRFTFYPVFYDITRSFSDIIKSNLIFKTIVLQICISRFVIQKVMFHLLKETYNDNVFIKREIITFILFKTFC